MSVLTNAIDEIDFGDSVSLVNIIVVVLLNFGVMQYPKHTHCGLDRCCWIAPAGEQLDGGSNYLMIGRCRVTYDQHQRTKLLYRIPLIFIPHVQSQSSRAPP